MKSQLLATGFALICTVHITFAQRNPEAWALFTASVEEAINKQDQELARSLYFKDAYTSDQLDKHSVHLLKIDLTPKTRIEYSTRTEDRFNSLNSPKSEDKLNFLIPPEGILSFVSGPENDNWFLN